MNRTEANERTVTDEIRNWLFAAIERTAELVDTGMNRDDAAIRTVGETLAEFRSAVELGQGKASLLMAAPEMLQALDGLLESMAGARGLESPACASQKSIQAALAAATKGKHECRTEEAILRSVQSERLTDFITASQRFSNDPSDLNYRALDNASVNYQDACRAVENCQRKQAA